MGNRKNVIALVVLLLGHRSLVPTPSAPGFPRHQKIAQANLSELFPGDRVVMSKPPYGCSSLADMTVFRGNAVAHDGIGFGNHLASAHCQKMLAGPLVYRILKLSDGEGGIRYVDEVNDPHSGAAIWHFGEARTFSLAKPPEGIFQAIWACPVSPKVRSISSSPVGYERETMDKCSRRSASQTLMMDCRVIPIFPASLSNDSIIHKGKSTFTRFCSCNTRLALDNSR